MDVLTFIIDRIADIIAMVGGWTIAGFSIISLFVFVFIAKIVFKFLRGSK